jgi:UDP-2-acetamido-3-amino-2,3-dideoxy-glucuronate N-acetyltransferase
MRHPSAYVHDTAIVEPGAKLGFEAKVWHFCHVRAGAELGDLVSLGRDVYVDKGVQLGRGSRVQNGVSLYAGVHVSDWCFIGPHAIFTNDTHPRVGKSDWTLEHTYLRPGSSVGAGAVIRCGIEIGSFALVGAGAVVTKNVEPFTLVMGLPAEPSGRVCACGETRLPHETPNLGLIQQCCERLLLPEVLELARTEVAKLGP